MMEEEINTTEIEEEIYSTLENMLQLKGAEEIRETRADKSGVKNYPVDDEEALKNGWQDTLNGPGILLYSEALLCFVLPIFLTSELEDKIRDLIPLSVVEETLDKIIEWTEEGFFGSPYLDFSEDTPLEEDVNFIDSASFVLSALLYSKMAFGDDLSTDLVERMDERMIDALKVIQECHLGEDQGYSWGKKDKPEEAFLYSSWCAAETFGGGEISNLKQALPSEKESLINEIQEELRNTRKWVEKRFIDDPDEDLDLTEGLLDFGTAEPLKAYYNLYALTILLYTDSSRWTEIEDGFAVLINNVGKEKDETLRNYLTRDFKFWFDGKEKLTGDKSQPYTDRTFLPLIIKALSRYIGDNETREREYGDELSFFYGKLLENRSDEFEGVWDEETEYSIYYTERAIESLCKLHSYAEGTVEPDGSEEPTIDVVTKIPPSEIREELLSDEEFVEKLADKLYENLEANFIEELVEKWSEYIEKKGGKSGLEEIKEEMESVKKATRE